MSGVVPAQVAEIIVELTGERRRRGSGYRVAPGAVLTAAHVVEDAVSVRVRFDADQASEWSTEAIWRWVDRSSDLAVLKIAPRQNEPMVVTARFGWISDRPAVLTARVVGFPRFKLKKDGIPGDADESTCYRDSHQADGSIAVLSNRRQGTLEITVPSPERDPDPTVSPWEGMSGAAVWVGDRIVGVIAEHHRADGLGRLAAARLNRTLEGFNLERRAELRALLGLTHMLPDVVPPSASTLVITAYQAQVRAIAPDHLLDRGAELDELVGFCAGDQPYAWWQAGPWAGKSALMSWFVLHPPADVDVVSFFVTARLDEQSDSDAYTSALIEQLTALVGESPAGLLTIGAQRGTMLSLLDDAASRAREVRRRLLLVIDGLDEDRSAERGRASIAALLPRQPPPEVRVLVASRPHPPIPADVTEDHPLRTITPRQLSVSIHAREMERRAYLELTQLLKGSPLERDVLGLITAAGGGITTSDLQELTQQPPYEIRYLMTGSLGRSIGNRFRSSPPIRPGERVYLFAHETLRVVAEQQYGNNLALFRDRLHSWADSYRARSWPADTPLYLLGSYPRMLASTRDLARLVSCATDQARHDRMRDLTGGDALALTEISTAQRLLLADPDPDLTSLALISFQGDHLASRNAATPSYLPAVWAKLGQVTRAEALAHSIPDIARRFDALRQLAEAVARSGDFHRAKVLAGQITDPYQRIQALLPLVKATEHHGEHTAQLIGEMETLAELIRDPIQRRAVSLTLLEAIAVGSNLNRAEEILAQKIHDQEWALLAVAAAAVAAGDLVRAEALAERITDPFLRVRALLPLVAAVRGNDEAARLTAEAAALTKQITDPYRRGSALAELSGVVAARGDRNWATQLIAEAETLAVQTDPATRGTELAGLSAAAAASGDHERAVRLAADVETLTERITNPERRAWVLCRLAEAVAVGGDHDRAVGLTQQAEVLATQISDSSTQKRALAELSEALAISGDLKRAEALVKRIADPIKQTAPLLALVKATAATGNLNKALALMTQLLPGQRGWVVPFVVEAAAMAGDLGQAATLIELTGNPFHRVQALCSLLSAAEVRSDHAPLATKAELLTGQITDTFERVHALTALARTVCALGDGDRDRRLTSQAKDLAVQSRDPYLMGLAMLEAARYDLSRSAQLVEVEALVTEIPDLGQQVRLLCWLANITAATGHHDRAAHLIARVEALIQQHTNPYLQVEALGQLMEMSTIGDSERATRLITQAETATALITNVEQRTKALSRIAMALMGAIGGTSMAQEANSGSSTVLHRARSFLAEALVNGSWINVVTALAHVDPAAVGALADELQVRWGFDTHSSAQDEIANGS